MNVMKKEELKTDEFVILIDAAYLDEVGHSMNGYFSYIVKRKLPKADLPALVEGLALDAGIRPGDNHIQIILVYPKGMKTFSFCEPSDLNEELHCVAFRSNLGEFSLLLTLPRILLPVKNCIQILFKLCLFRKTHKK